MVQNINPSRLNSRVEIGGSKFAENAQGGNTPIFNPEKKLWCGLYTISMTQQITLLGSPESFDLVLIIRHQKDGLNGARYACYKDKLYKITGSSPDADDSARSFDLIILKRTDEIGLS